MGLDIKDIRIMYELGSNARISYSNLAKRVGLSREVVQYRIKRLIDNKYIKWFTIIIDASKLGYNTYQFYIKLEKATEEKEKKLINFLIKDKRVDYVVTTSGNWDLMLECYARNPREVHQFINEIKDISKIIKKINFGTIIREFASIDKIIINYKDLGYKSKLTDIHRFSESNIKLDKEDKLILYYLSQDSRIKYTDLAKKIGISVDKVTYKITNLIKKKVIQSFKTIYDFSKFNFQHYIILFQLEASNEETTNFFNYLKIHKNAIYVLEVMGGWDITVAINVKDSKEFRRILLEIKNKFSDIIQDESILLAHEEFKNNYIPPNCYPESK